MTGEVIVYAALLVLSSSWLPFLAWRGSRSVAAVHALPGRPAFRGAAPLALPAADVAEPVAALELVG